MKHLIFYRYGSPNRISLANGDVFDSIGVLKDGPREIWRSNHVNTDSTQGYKGGRLAAGAYFGIVGYRANGKRVIKLFNHPAHDPLTQITRADQLTAGDMTLPSEIPNPNHNYQHVIQYVQVHSCGYRGAALPSTDWSRGCITVLETGGEYDDLMKQLAEDEVIMVSLINPTNKPEKE
jgi:hypothetical protein